MGINAEDEALFWIAKESTGSARDAYTLLDQVVSFSEGHIRAELIREKLGLVGLDCLNAFAETCAANDLEGAFSQLDSILDAGVAVEQFIIDLAGYYHNLLLIKAGITRPSILGFNLERFSAKVLEKLDAARLAHAGELLFDLYRDLRYSLSPRFELKTLSSKLCWLDRWISPPELTEALKQVKALLSNHQNPHNTVNPGSHRPLTEHPLTEHHTVSRPSADNVTKSPANTDESKPVPQASAEVSFNDMYSQWQADKKNPDIEDFPVSPNRGLPSAPDRSELNPAVQSVLRIFNGTIVNNNEPR
jgi:DNA polymerase-3 subunit gamma/tau